MDYTYIELLEKTIAEKSFPNNYELKEFLDNALRTIKENSAMMNEFKEKGLYSELDSNQTSFYNYFFKHYENTHVTEPNLNVDNISSFTIEGKDYIKYIDSEGSYRIIENNDPTKSYIEQIKEKQQSSIEFQLNDGEQNKQEILKTLTEERREVGLEYVADATYELMNAEELANFKAITNYDLFKDRNMLFNASDNIYLDVDTGEIFYVAINEQGDREIRKVNENYTLTDKKEDVKYNESMDEETNLVESPGVEYSSFSEFELYYIIENRDGKMPESAIAEAKNELERRKNLQPNDLNYMRKEKPKQYVLNMNKPYNGFTSIMTLALITTLYGIGFVIYLSLMIK